jgi:membrane-associated phospholipid phosphatase
MSQENLRSTDQKEVTPWWRRPWKTRTLVASLIGGWAVLTIVNLIVLDIGWFGVLRGAVVLIIVGGLSVIWNERRNQAQ